LWKIQELEERRSDVENARSPPATERAVPDPRLAPRARHARTERDRDRDDERTGGGATDDDVGAPILGALEPRTSGLELGMLKRDEIFDDDERVARGGGGPATRAERRHRDEERDARTDRAHGRLQLSRDQLGDEGGHECRDHRKHQRGFHGSDGDDR